MSKTKVYVLTDTTMNEVIGVVDDEKFAQAWCGGSDIRSYDEFEINVVKCEECKGNWHFGD